VVVGDVNPKQIQALAETYFGRIPSGPKPEPVRTVEPKQDAERRVVLRAQSQRIVAVAYHKPDINHPDDAVYNAIGSILSEGRSSRLNRALVRDKKIAVAAMGMQGLPGRKYPGLFLFAGITASGHTNQEVEKALSDEIDRLKRELVTAEELEGVKQRARASLINSLRDNMGLANALADWQVLTGDWHNLFRQIDRINAVTPQDIQRVANATFVDNNKTVAALEPVEAAGNN
jgi:predicted Zn-dependent peptidase